MSAEDRREQQQQDARRAYARERDEPEEKSNPVPLAFLIFSVIIVVWGMSYFYVRIGSVTDAGDMRTPVVAEAGGDEAVDGGAVYTSKCASCHQDSGEGVAGAFPPLDGSGWVTASAEVPVQIILRGVTGEIEVAGDTYQGSMPAWDSMSDAEIAAVTTYIRQNWSNDADEVDADFVAEQREATADREQPWDGGKEIRAEVGEPEG